MMIRPGLISLMPVKTLNRKSLVFFLIMLGAFACNRKAVPSATSENFDQFYARFHQDLDFQLERVQFPLEGGYVDVEGRTEWTQEDWEMHKEMVTDIREPDYDTEIVKRDDLVIDKVKLRDSGFFTERRFKLIDGKWYLVYYESVNL